MTQTMSDVTNAIKTLTGKLKRRPLPVEIARYLKRPVSTVAYALTKLQGAGIVMPKRRGVRGVRLVGACVLCGRAT